MCRKAATEFDSRCGHTVRRAKLVNQSSVFGRRTLAELEHSRLVSCCHSSAGHQKARSAAEADLRGRCWAAARGEFRNNEYAPKLSSCSAKLAHYNIIFTLISGVPEKCYCALLVCKSTVF